jgi:gamma-glutamylcyclotransferase (GGCT)/AIG2-like uncharacterized protein YtfP
VYGILYRVTMDQLDDLDGYEGVPDHYKRKKMKVYTDGKNSVEAWVYVANTKKTRSGLIPTERYIKFLLQGYGYLPKDYYDQLYTMYYTLYKS